MYCGMIVLLEPVCSVWVHEEVNAGFLQLVIENSVDDVLYIGERGHLSCIKKIFYNSRIRFVEITKTIGMGEADYYINTVYYFRLLNDVIVRCNPRKLFILCGYRPCILASELAALIYKKIDIYFVLHGMVDEKKGRTQSYMKLLRFGRLCRKLCFVTYSPYCTGKYWGISESKLVFLHHPYVHRNQMVSEAKEKDKSGKVIIGIIGACANDKAEQLISAVNRNDQDCRYEFWVASRFGKRFRHLKNIKILDCEFERKEMEALLKEMDFLLLPYGHDEYALSASGVLWDAMANGLPCLMLDSSYFKYYMRYEIGYQADSMQELCKVICKIIRQKQEMRKIFFVNMEEIERENIETIKYLLR